MLQHVLQDPDAGVGLRGVLVRLLTQPLLELLRELLHAGAIEVGVPHRESGHAFSLVARLQQRRRLHAAAECRHARDVQPEARERLHDREHVGDVPGPHDPVDVGRLDARRLRGQIRRARLETEILDDLQSGRPCLLLEIRLERLTERGVFVEQRDPGDRGAELLAVRLDRFQHVAGRQLRLRVDAEQIPEPGLRDLVRHRIGDDERRLEPLGHAGDRHGDAAHVRADDDHDLVVVDDRLGLTRADVGLAFVIADDELELGAPERLDPALRVDFLDRELVAGLFLRAVGGVAARHREERPDDDLARLRLRVLEPEARAERERGEHTRQDEVSTYTDRSNRHGLSDRHHGRRIPGEPTAPARMSGMLSRHSAAVKRQAHRRRVPKMFFDYADAGSYNQETLRANREVPGVVRPRGEFRSCGTLGAAAAFREESAAP